MRTILLLFAAAAYIGAQTPTTITGPIKDSSGALATCQLIITPATINSYSPSIIFYSIIGGDLTGSTGGYGTGLKNVTRHAALQLYPGTYSVLADCAGEYKKYTWNVPYVSAWSLTNLNQGIGQTLGQITTTLGSTPGGLGSQ